MARSKRDWFKSFWIPLEKRRPPDTDDKILYWNARYKRIGETMGHILNVQQDQLRDIPGMRQKIEGDPAKAYLDGYFATHWMPRWAPEGEEQ